MRLFLSTMVVLVAVFFTLPIMAGGSTNICQDAAGHDGNTTAATFSGGNSTVMYTVINAAREVTSALKALPSKIEETLAAVEEPPEDLG